MEINKDPMDEALENAKRDIIENPTQKEMLEIIMIPCLRCGYHTAIIDFMKFLDKIDSELPNKTSIKISDKLLDMMNKKRTLEWDILRDEQTYAVNEVIKKRQSNEHTIHKQQDNSREGE